MRSFAENETEHAKRLGETLRRTKMMRRALTVKLQQEEVYPREMPYHIIAMSMQELQDALAVTPKPQKTKKGKSYTLFVPTEDARSQQSLDSFARQIFGTHSSGPGSKRRVRLARGQHVGSLPFGFIEQRDGQIVPNPEIADFLRDAIYVVSHPPQGKKGGYTAAANVLNEHELQSARGGPWNNDKARDFIRNPYLAGYNRVLPDKRNWRTRIDLYPSKHRPLITLEEWIVANAHFCMQATVEFPEGFRNKQDQYAWEHRTRLIANP